MILKKSKKANMTYQELILIIVTSVIVAFTLVVASLATSNASKKVSNYDLTISYKFPAAFIHEFLYQKLDKKYNGKLNLDDNKQYFVKDIIQMKKAVSKTYIEDIRNEFIDKQKTDYNQAELTNSKNALKLYEHFSNTKLDLNNLIKIDYMNIAQFNNLNLEDSINNKNYFYYFYTQDNEIVVIYFKGEALSSENGGTVI